MAIESESGCQFIGHQLEVGRPVERKELLEEGNGLGWPIRPMIAAGEFGGELRAFLEESGA